VKRPILAFLAAVILNFGVVGTAPARAATPDSTTAAATPLHHHGHGHHQGDHDGGSGSHRHHPREHDGDGGDHGGGHRGRCAGLIVVCLL
jgi:hypothetical protein